MSKINKKFSFKRIPLEFTSWDIIAFFVFVLLATWNFIAIRRGIHIADESFYYIIPYRLMQGDRLFVDEWNLTQLSFVFQYLPFRLFVFLTGGTEGVILFMRGLAVCVAQLISLFVYFKLRNYKLIAILISFPYAMWFFATIRALSYHTLPVYLMMVICLVFFTGAKPLAFWQSVFIGLLFSCVVLTQPLYVVIFLIFSLLSLIHIFRPKFLSNFDFVLNKKTWLGITLGCLIAFVLVVGVILFKTGIADFFKAIPELFTDSEFDLSFGNLLKLVLEKMNNALYFYGKGWIIGSFLCCIAAAVYRRRFKNDNRIKLMILLCASVLFLSQIVCSIFYSYSNSLFQLFLPHYFFYFSVPSSILGLTAYILTENKNRRAFLFWIVSFLMSSISIVTSQVVISASGLLNQTPLLIFLKQLWDESKNEFTSHSENGKQSVRIIKNTKIAQKNYLLTKVAVVCSMVALICWTCFGGTIQVILPIENLINNDPISSSVRLIENGPYKGIKTSPTVKKAYERILSDLDVIKHGSDGGPLYVMGNCPINYLYSNRQIGIYSAWYAEQDSETRPLRYWELHPEKRPKFIYIPLYIENLDFSKTWHEEKERMDQKLDFIQSIAECTYQKGKAGYIVRIDAWKDLRNLKS